MNFKWTPELDEKLKQLIESSTYEQAARMLGTTKHSVRSRAERLNLCRPVRGPRQGDPSARAPISLPRVFTKDPDT